MTLKELLAIDEGGDCTGCPVCEPPRTRRGGPPARRSVSVLVSQDAAASFSVRYADARGTPTKEEGEGVVDTASSEA